MGRLVAVAAVEARVEAEAHTGVAALVGYLGGGSLSSEAGPPGEAVGCGGGAAAAVSNPEIGVELIVTSAVVATYEGIQFVRKRNKHATTMSVSA